MEKIFCLGTKHGTVKENGPIYLECWGAGGGLRSGSLVSVSGHSLHAGGMGQCEMGKM